MHYKYYTICNKYKIKLMKILTYQLHKTNKKRQSKNHNSLNNISSVTCWFNDVQHKWIGQFIKQRRPSRFRLYFRNITRSSNPMAQMEMTFSYQWWCNSGFSFTNTTVFYKIKSLFKNILYIMQYLHWI